MCASSSRTDEPRRSQGFNQSPNPLSADLTTNQDLNGVANQRENRSGSRTGISFRILQDGAGDDDGGLPPRPDRDRPPCDMGGDMIKTHPSPLSSSNPQPSQAPSTAQVGSPNSVASVDHVQSRLEQIKHALITFSQFVGPGFMISVAYIDPGNYATDIAAGASYRFQLLFIVLLSNLFAILLQSLAIKLGTVTGLDLSSACRAFLPRWLNYSIYALAEIAIIATDIAEVIGTAIAFNLLSPKIPLVAGCALSIIDVMLILIFYNPTGHMRGLRIFEFFVCILVMGVVVCFCIQLSMISNTSVGQVFRGYLPSVAVIEQQGLYQACGILGATVMPHSLFLGSGIVQPRLRAYDEQHGLLPAEPVSANSSTDSINADKVHYIPSQSAIKHSLKYSIAELALSLSTFALFVNSAILIVAGASLYNNPDALDADIFAIHSLLSSSISPAAGTIFALALLLSGISAGIVCTIAGQMVSEGALRWKMRPWLRRLVTRLISITPSIIIAAAVGREGLNAALQGSQVALSVVLPFVTAPLIWFTSRDRYMMVMPGQAQYRVEGEEEDERPLFSGRRAWMGRENGAEGGVKMANSWLTTIAAGLVWGLIAVMNVANLVLLGKGNS
ncbi:natural resistance-associated macrophage protein-domain-containing protein [Pseudoneurospora amorphoporcata]|uniref:Natural resistance-associated macrophage protein-domain-containing protein n=1 Tax=Pseudoneurospora amorphoporcata TaxID=241081 RepID=A0AAN6P0P9_9PEZI|nr:natural resistance-associated macrophage protein-domain-containing protein [Pseudoneurospora amorphoporcata]